MDWLKNNKWEVCITIYLILLFISHHTFTPNLAFFRELTSQPLLRMSLLGLVIYALYNYSKFRPHVVYLLIILFLLTEYHARGSYQWEFFQNNLEITFIKKAGSNLYLTYPVPAGSGQLISLSEAHGDFSGQMWQLNVDTTGGITMSPFTTDSTKVDGAIIDLNGDLKMIEDTNSTNKWTMTEVVKTLVEDSIQTIDTDNAKTLTGIKDVECKTNTNQYAKLKFGDQYLTANSTGQLALSETDSDNIWYIFKCMPNDKPVDLETPAEKVTEEDSNKIETITDQPKGCLENFMNSDKGVSLNELLNQFRTDTPIGKAYRNCSDGLCYYEKIPKIG